MTVLERVIAVNARSIALLAVVVLCGLSLGAGLSTADGTEHASDRGHGTLDCELSLEHQPVSSNTIDSVATATEGTADSAGPAVATVAAAGPTHGTVTPATTSANATSDETPLIGESIVLEPRPDRPGEFDAVVRYDLPDEVSALQVRPDSDATVLESNGLEPADEDGIYEWEGDGDDHERLELVLRLEANRSDIGRHSDRRTGFDDVPTDGDGATRSSSAPLIRGHDHAPDAGDGYTFADTGEWGIVAVPHQGLAWSQSSPVGVDREVSVDGDGFASDDIAVFGPVAVEERTAGGETIRLVVPAAADLEESPDDVLETLAFASERLRIGAHSETVTVIAAPTGEVDWGANGVTYGDHDAWVRDDARLDVPGNVWLHEYVHTRQAYAGESVDRDARWLIEAQAEYYAASLTYERGLIDHREFERFLAEGQESPYADGALADPGTWQDPITDYVKGPLAYGAIDRELRLATDGEFTLESVFRELNHRDGDLTNDRWLAFLEEAGGPDVRATAELYTETDAVPDTWDQSAHEAAFGQPTPAMAYDFPPTDSAGEDVASSPVTVDGLLETRTLTEPRPVIVGETVTYAVGVENAGDRDGPYRATLTVDGTLVDDASGSLEAGESTVASLAWTPEEPGRYVVNAGDVPFTVDVLEPAPLTVTGLESTPDEAEPGDRVTVTATVANDADRTGKTTLEFRTSEGTVVEESVVLAAGETTTVERTIGFDEAAVHEIRVGDHTTSVTVQSGPTSPATETVDSIPGFSAALALAAIAVALLAGHTVAVAAGRRR